MAVSKANKGSSTIGLQLFTIAPIIEDTLEGTTYGDLLQIDGIVEATITPENTEADVQYADDVEYDVVNPDPELTIVTTLAAVPLDVQKEILGHQMDSNGVLVKSATDTPKYFAVGFRAEKADHTFRYMWLLKMRAQPLTENLRTKEGETITRQTGEISWTAIKRTSDQQYQYVADEGLNGFTKQKAETFLQSVYTPVLPSA